MTISKENNIALAQGQIAQYDGEKWIPVQPENLNTFGDAQYTPINKRFLTDRLADDAEITLADLDVSGTNVGYGVVMTLDTDASGDGWMIVKWEGSTVTILSSIGEVDDADTDAKLCVYYDAGNDEIRIKNRLGGNVVVFYDVISYNIPDM